MWFPNRSDTNRPVQAQKRARCLKFRLYVEEELYYPSSENKGADQLRGYRAFVFTYADCWFSHGAAHMYHTLLFNRNSNSHSLLLSFVFCVFHFLHKIIDKNLISKDNINIRIQENLKRKLSKTRICFLCEN